MLTLPALAPTTAVHLPRNEPVLDYAPGSPERAALRAALARARGEEIEMPLVIGGRAVRTGRLETAVMPHDHAHVLGHAHLASTREVEAAIAAAKAAAPAWSRQPWRERAAVFLRAAHLLAGPWRYTLNAATMLGQSKTAHQAEIDSAAELIDFWRFNVAFMQRIHEEQPLSPPGARNTADYRPLEGFILALTPFNFTAIAGNLPSAPALMGNTVVWKPSAAAKYAAHFVMEILRKAGLPDGVINLVYGDPEDVTRVALADPDFAGLHFTGSTAVFNALLSRIGQDIGRYRTYPRVVGETGGKNFIMAHASAETDALATAVIRGGYEYQGQKCSAASRVFVPASLWPRLQARLCDEIATIDVGDVCDFRNFMGAVIDERAWRRHRQVIDEAGFVAHAKTLYHRPLDGERGYFIGPTLIETSDLHSRFMTEEFFGPIVTAFVYPDNEFDSCLAAIDAGGRYALTGTIFASDKDAILAATQRLRHTAGNFYINDKPTGAVVGQQPFGGGRASGTNDKAGSLWNLMRWTSPRTVKETFAPPTDYRYPFMAES